MHFEEERYQARFGGIGRLLGQPGLARLRQAHVGVVGLGGVGSWAVEALARSGIGALTLIDLDDVCVTNVNRQLHALDGELGRPKVEVLAKRVRAINPFCEVYEIRSFFLKSNASTLLQTRYDFVLDAIDSPSVKALLIASCFERGIPVITVGGSGARQDPTAIEVADLAFSSHDRLLQEVRRKLRQRYGFPRGDQPFGVECVLSREPLVGVIDESMCIREPHGEDLPLDCGTRFGTASFVTGTFGFVAASRIIRVLAQQAVAPNQIPAKSSAPLVPPVWSAPLPVVPRQTDTPRQDSPDGSGLCPSLVR